MINLLIDTNVILDYLLDRKPFVDDSEKIIELTFTNHVKSFISASTVTDIYYIIRKEKGKTVALDFLKALTDFVEIAEVNKQIVLAALNSSLEDFEDAVQLNTAKYHEFNYLITRNTKDFQNADIPIFTPSKFIEFINNSSDLQTNNA